MSGSQDKTVKLWKAASGQSSYSVSEPDEVNAVAFSPDGTLVASVGDDRRISLWNAVSGRQVDVFAGTSTVGKWSAFLPTASQLLFANSDSLELWDTISGRPVVNMTGYPGSMYTGYDWDFALSPDGKLVASGAIDRIVRLWNTESGQLLRSFSGHTGPLRAIAFSPESKVLASGSEDKTVKLWDPETGILLRTLKSPDQVETIVFSKDGSIVAAGGDDGQINIWDVSTGHLLRNFRARGKFIDSLAFSNSTKTLISSDLGDNDSLLAIWDTGKGTISKKFAIRDGFAVSAKGDKLAFIDPAGTLIVYNLETSRTIQRIPVGPSFVSLAFSFGGGAIAAFDDKNLRTWDITSGELKTYGNERSNPFSADDRLTFSSDGRLRVNQIDGGVAILDAKTSKELAALIHERTDFGIGLASG